MVTVEKVEHVYREVKTICQLGRFNLLISINELVTWSISEKDTSEAEKKILEAEPHTSSLRGMQWILFNDTLEQSLDQRCWQGRWEHASHWGQSELKVDNSGMTKLIN